MATYGFFAVALVGRQYVEGDKKSFQMPLDAYFPVFTVLQFFFFMGLLKVTFKANIDIMCFLSQISSMIKTFKILFLHYI